MIDLCEAHAALDAVVENAYGVDFDRDEERIVDHRSTSMLRMTKEMNSRGRDKDTSRSQRLSA